MINEEIPTRTNFSKNLKHAKKCFYWYSADTEKEKIKGNEKKSFIGNATISKLLTVSKSSAKKIKIIKTKTKSREIVAYT